MGVPWFKFYPNDYLADTKVMLLSRVHRSLLLECWCLCCKDGSIPSDPRKLASLLNEDPRTIAKFLEKVCKFFVTVPEIPGSLHSPRMMKETEKYNTKASKLRTAGALGGKQKAANALANATKMLGESESESEKDKRLPPTPLQGEKKKRKPREEKAKEPTKLEEILEWNDLDYFDVFWEVIKPFPENKKTWPMTIAKTFMAAVRSGVDPAEIHIAAVKLGKTTDPQYMPNAAKWLKEQGWRAYANR